MSNQDELVSFDNPDVKSAFDPNRKTERFDPKVGIIDQITFELEGAIQRSRHYGRRYEMLKGYDLNLSPDDIKKGHVILPERVEKKDEEGNVVGMEPTGNDAVYAHVTEGKEKWGYRRCLSFTGFCSGCTTAKGQIDKKDKKRVTPAADIYGANIAVWLTDDKGNLLDKHSKRPIDSEGSFIELDDDGTWDQESYVATEDKGVPTAKVQFYQFGSDKFVQVRQIKRTTKKGGPFKNLNILVECTDAAFKKATLTALLHAASAANTRRPWLDSEFKTDGIKALGKWLCREISQDEMVYFFGLEVSLLGKNTKEFEDNPEDLANPPASEAKKNGEAAKEPEGADLGGNLEEDEEPTAEEPTAEEPTAEEPKAAEEPKPVKDEPKATIEEVAAEEASTVEEVQDLLDEL